MYAPSLAQVQDQFDDVHGVLTSMSMTIYVLGFAVGPVLFAPLSEIMVESRCTEFVLRCTCFLPSLVPSPLLSIS